MFSSALSKSPKDWVGYEKGHPPYPSIQVLNESESIYKGSFSASRSFAAIDRLHVFFGKVLRSDVMIG